MELELKLPYKSSEIGKQEQFLFLFVLCAELPIHASLYFVCEFSGCEGVFRPF